MKIFLTPGYQRALVASDLRHGGASFAELHGISFGRDCDRYRPPLHPAKPRWPVYMLMLVVAMLALSAALVGLGK